VEPLQSEIMPTVSTTDPVLESQVFWERYKKTVMAALVIAVLALAAYGGYQLYSTRRANTAADRLGNAKTAADFQKVISEYPGTAAGASAYLFLANVQKTEKKFAEANATLQAFLDKHPKHELAGTARLAMGANLEALGKKDEALALYQRLVTSDPKAYTAPVALISQVHVLKEKNQIEEARRVCDTVMTQYRESGSAQEAQRLLRLLKVPNEPAAPPTTTVTVPAPPVNSVPPPAQSVGPSAAAPPVPKAPQPSAPKKP
jgi:predicted negative regulator of RcsB-dependent stress response